MSFDKEKIKTAINSINDACLHCGSSHTNECPVSTARQALKSVE
ncbi:MAG: hypothetical protein PHH85_13380 [Candidatus Methanoperedens sp.]|nr:hypothetical protein [Candidatus Methanoperedens sp.]